MCRHTSSTHSPSCNRFMLDARAQQGLNKHVISECAKRSETWCVFILRKKNRVDVSRGLQPDGAQVVARRATLRSMCCEAMRPWICRCNAWGRRRDARERVTWAMRPKPHLSMENRRKRQGRGANDSVHSQDYRKSNRFEWEHYKEWSYTYLFVILQLNVKSFFVLERSQIEQPERWGRRGGEGDRMSSRPRRGESCLNWWGSVDERWQEHRSRGSSDDVRSEDESVSINCPKPKIRPLTSRDIAP
jgi:hypothetical protein